MKQSLTIIQQRYEMRGVLLLLALLTLALAACGEPEEQSAVLDTPPAATATSVPLPVTPVEVTESFYNWYIARKQEIIAGSRPGSPVGLYHGSRHVSDALTERLDEVATGGLDPVLLAETLPQAIRVESQAESEAEATVLVTEEWSDASQRLLVELALQEGAWKLTNIRPAELVE